MSQLTADERAWQDATGGRLQEQAYARPGTRAVLDRQHERIVAALHAGAWMRILDVGCGVGHLLGWLADRLPARYFGVDLSVQSLHVARARVTTVSVGDAARLPFHNAAYDRVVCNGAAHHLPDLRLALGEMHRVLRPGGRVVLHEPVEALFAGAVRRTLLARSRYESPADLAHKHEFSRAFVEDALRAAGFVDIATERYDFLAYPLSGMYVAFPWSRSRRAMRALIRLEDGLARLAVMRPVWGALAWRVLFTARKPV